MLRYNISGNVSIDVTQIRDRPDPIHDCLVRNIMAAVQNLTLIRSGKNITGAALALKHFSLLCGSIVHKGTSESYVSAFYCAFYCV